jgi:hypothetical protein
MSSASDVFSIGFGSVSTDFQFYDSAEKNLGIAPSAACPQRSNRDETTATEFEKSIKTISNCCKITAVQGPVFSSPFCSFLLLVQTGRGRP